MSQFCEQCGQPLKTGAKFCGKCGSVVTAQPVPVSTAPVNPSQTITQTSPATPPIPPKTVAPAKARGGRIVFLIIAAAIVLIGVGLFALRYSQDHSPSGRAARFQIAASKGDMQEVFRVAAEAKDAKQPVDMTDGLYYALMNGQGEAAQYIKDMGGNEMEARKRLEEMERVGLEPTWKNIHLKGSH